MTVEAIQDEALRLAPEERARLIDALCDSLLDPQMMARLPAWIAESESRIDAVEAGLLPALDSDEALQKLRQNLRK